MSARIKLTTADDGSILGVFLDDLPQGSPAEFLAAHPQHAGAYAEALEAHTRQQFKTALTVLQVRLASAEAALDQMRAKYEPPPAPANLLVVELPKAIGAADHVGITGIVKGRWHGDLLKRTGENAYVLVEEDGLVFPAGESVTSLSELTREQIETDLAAYALAASADAP
jgi:hypothetical protein